MQLPGIDASSDTYLEYTDHVEGAAEAWADAENLTAAERAVVLEVSSLLQPAATTLRGALTTTQVAERAAIKARVRYRVRDKLLDKSVMRISDAVFNGPAGRSRDHATYAHVFRNEPASKITRASIYEEPEIVGRMLDRYDGLDDFAGKATARDVCSGALGRSLKARDALESVEEALNKAGDTELAARMGLRHALEQAYGKLRTAFPGRRDFVESFFPKRDKKKRAASPQQSEDEES